MRADDFFYMQTIEIQASKQVYKLHRINRHELATLAGIACYLQIHNKKIISKHLFFQWLGSSYKLNRKLFGYVEGLISKGCLTRLAYRRSDGQSLCLSPYGVRVLDKYYEVLSEFERKHSARLKHPGYKYLMQDINNLPHGYILKQAGRE